MTLANQTIIQLWPDDPPGTESWNHSEREATTAPPDSFRFVYNVSQPTLTVCLPTVERTTDASVIICPGGAFHIHSIDHEGFDVARWLNKRGVTAFVLKYRLQPVETEEAVTVWPRPLPPGTMERVRREIAPLACADGRRAVEIVRKQAREWTLSPDRIGMLGFSAGGRVASDVAINHDARSRPNFAASIYGALSGDMAVPADAPPLFIAVAADDRIAADNCRRLYAAWLESGHSVEYHGFAAGGHGFGMNRRGLPIDLWIDLFGAWMDSLFT